MGLTGGTTTSAVARALASRDDLTVVTNAVNIASDLTVRARARVFMAGGFVRPQSYEVVGPTAIQALSRLSLGYAFIGVDGISASAGLTTHDEVEAQTNLAMLSRAHRVVVVADGRKVGRQLMAQIAPAEAAHELITTAGADPVRSSCSGLPGSRSPSSRSPAPSRRTAGCRPARSPAHRSRRSRRRRRPGRRARPGVPGTCSTRCCRGGGDPVRSATAQNVASATASPASPRVALPSAWP